MPQSQTNILSFRKILFLIESLSGGGAEKVLTVLLKYFDYNRYELTVCPMVDTGIYCDEVKKYVTHYRPVVSYQGNVFCRFLNKVKYKLIYSVLPLSVVYKWFIPKGNDVEIAFCEGFVTKLLSEANSHSKKIAWVHIDLEKLPWTIDKGIYKNVEEEKKAYSTFDKIVCVSKTVEQSFHERYGLNDRTCTIYNPIDVEDIREKAGERTQPSDGVFRMISIGRLVPQKGYDRLLRVTKQLHDKGRNVYLLILGEGEERSSLEQYVSENKMHSYVALPGFDKNPYRHLVNSDLFVCSSRAEGFSLVIAEAMALGVPVLSTYCSGPNELLQEGKYGMLVENMEDAIANGLEKAIEDYDRLIKQTHEAQKRILSFASDVVLKQIGKVLEN